MSRGWGQDGDYDRGGDELVDFPGCQFGSVSKSGKAIYVTFPDGARRWVPFSQMAGDVAPPEPNSRGTLSVTAWIAQRWEEEGEDPRNRLVRVPGVVVLRETAKALQVRAPDLGEPVWLAKSHVDPGSEVQNDGDQGVLVIPNWVAEEKGLVPSGVAEGAPRRSPSVAEDVRRAGTRRAAPDRQEPLDLGRQEVDPDDDIPF